MKKIKKVDSKEVLVVRHPVLRAGMPIESCIFDGDTLETTVHFGFFIDEKIIGVLSVFKNNNAIFQSDKQFQIRGMAILADYQKNGYGEQLIYHAENYIKNLNGELIWFNARENAVGFYKKLDYISQNKAFMIANIGVHYIMKKDLC